MKQYKFILGVFSFFVALSLTGCGVKMTPKNIKSNVNIQNQEDTITNTNDFLESCEKELNALKDVDGVKYNALRNKFENIMKGAAGYSKVRNNLNHSTQDAIDALYRYSVTKLCTEISTETFEVLSSKPGV